jgi:hypothetical protein
MAFERIPAGATVTLTLEWTAESAESFPLIDLQSLALADGRESLQASWFATTGQLSSARTGGSAGDLATTSDNTWTAPQSTGLAFLWAVLRDSRGGSAAWTQQVEVVP